MKKIQINRAHTLGQNECQTMAEELLDKLVNKFGGNVSCVGQDYQYQHTSGVKATVEAREEELNVNVKLGIIASALAPKLESEINRILDKYIT